MGNHDKLGILSIKNFYQSDKLITLTKELTDTLRKNKTVDW